MSGARWGSVGPLTMQKIKNQILKWAPRFLFVVGRDVRTSKEDGERSVEGGDSAAAEAAEIARVAKPFTRRGAAGGVSAPHLCRGAPWDGGLMMLRLLLELLEQTLIFGTRALLLPFPPTVGCGW